MNRVLLLRPLAEEDVAGIFDHGSAEWSSAKALEYLEGLASVLETLRDYPEMARERMEFRPPVRVHRYRSHVIVYVASEREIEIIRILHGRSTWNALLAD